MLYKPPPPDPPEATAYPISAATNGSGTGPVSGHTNAVTPSGTLPPVQHAVWATPANGQALVGWTPESANGADQTRGYTIIPYVGSVAQTPVQVSDGSATSTVITGLTNGTAYTSTVAAVNEIGTGPASDPTAAVVPADTIFGLAAPPVVAGENDRIPVEVGVKFTADTDGAIIGMRFYKSSDGGGAEVGSLWDAGGDLLAQATFTDESSVGWQYVYFALPVNITAGATYVAGYFAPDGYYSATLDGLAGGVDNPPLHAPGGGAGPNGVYAYAATSTLPTNSYDATNYWVDVLFAPASSASGPVTGVTASAQAGGASVSWSAPSTGGTSEQVYDHALCRRGRAGPDHRLRVGDPHADHRADQRHDLHLHCRSHHHRWHRSRVGRLAGRHPRRHDLRFHGLPAAGRLLARSSCFLPREPVKPTERPEFRA